MLRRCLTVLRKHADVIGFCMITFGVVLLLLAWIDAGRI